MLHKHQQTRHGPLIIGWREMISLPEWGVRRLLAKSDSGARGSAIDVDNIKVLEDGKISFDIVLDRKDRSRTRHVVTDLAGVTRVRSSNGQIQERYKVRTTLRIGDVEKEVEFTLVNRRRMLCRALLGRSALGRDFLIDSSSKYLFGPRSSKTKK